MPPITGWPTVNFNCPAQRENMPNCDARWGPMGPMGPDCAVPPAKCVIIHVAPLIIMCVQTAFGNSHTHTLIHTDRRTCLLARWYREQFLLFCCGVSFIRFPLQTASTNDLGALWQERSQCIYVSLWCFMAEDLTTLKVDWGSQRSCRGKRRMSLRDIWKSRECRPAQSQLVHLLCSLLSICRLVWHEECGRASLFIEPT